MTDDRVKEILARTESLAETFVEGQKAHWRGTPYGMTRLNDAEFLAWFEDMARSDPLWLQVVYGLALVKGDPAAMKDVTRYEKLKGIGVNASEVGRRAPVQETEAPYA